MPSEYVRHEEEMDLPRGAGIPGLLKAVSEIARLPRVQQIVIKASGKIEYDFFLRSEETKQPLKVDFEKVMPYALARNGEIEEIPYPHESAAVAVMQLFDRAMRDHMAPLGFIGGEPTGFWAWYEETTGITTSSKDELLSFPFHTDASMENSSLLLCTGYRKNSLLSDVVKSYKITIPKVLRL